MPIQVTGYDPSWGSHTPVLVDILTSQRNMVLTGYLLKQEAHGKCFSNFTCGCNQLG